MKRRGQSKRRRGGALDGIPMASRGEKGARKKKEEILETEETGRVVITLAHVPGITDRRRFRCSSEIYK